MREQLIQYVELLFAGAPDSEEIKQEILQNTLDRFDDLIDQGKTPEAAYRLAISGIGDINEILGSEPKHTAPIPHAIPETSISEDTDEAERKKKRAVAVALYICCVIPVIALGELGNGGLGVCLMFLMIAAATALMIMSSKKEDDDEEEEQSLAPHHEQKDKADKLLSTITLPVYLIVSFVTGAWYITWLLFPLSACVKGLIHAIIDYKEASGYEN